VSGRLNGAKAITLGKTWMAELAGWLNTQAIYALAHAPWPGNLDAGLQKTLGSKWKAKLSVQDLLHTNRFGGRMQTASFSQVIEITRDSRIAMLNLTYAFGNQQLKGSRQRKTSSEEEMQRTNGLSWPQAGFIPNRAWVNRLIIVANNQHQDIDEETPSKTAFP
jgi:hypothetical protein